MTDRPVSELESLIGEAAFVRLAEAFGGTRLYLPNRLRDGDPIVGAIGREAADRLIARFAPGRLAIPLARELRARHYRSAGMSHVHIARRMGLTVSAIERLFARMADVPAKGSAKSATTANPDQFDLFG